MLTSSQSFKYNGCVRFTYNFSSDEYLYLMVNTKYGNAPGRNAFKRRARSLFNALIKEHSEISIGLMIKPLKQNVSYEDLRCGFGALNKKIILESN